MASSRLYEHGLRSLALPYLALVFTGVAQITLSSFGTQSGIVVLTVYANDILLSGSDSTGLLEIKEYLKRYFVTKDMRMPKYFLGIEVVHKKHSVLFSQ